MTQERLDFKSIKEIMRDAATDDSAACDAISSVAPTARQAVAAAAALGWARQHGYSEGDTVPLDELPDDFTQTRVVEGIQVTWHVWRTLTNNVLRYTVPPLTDTVFHYTVTLDWDKERQAYTAGCIMYGRPSLLICHAPPPVEAAP